MKTDDAIVPEAAFRIHRHDVMNVLQVVKAYIQLGRPEQALTSVNHLADWLVSLSVVQSHFPEDTNLLWEAAQSPHVWIRAVSNVSKLSDTLSTNLVDCLRSLEELVREHTNQAALVWVDGLEQTGACTSKLYLRVECPKPVMDVWTSQSAPCASAHIEICCEPSTSVDSK